VTVSTTAVGHVSPPHKLANGEFIEADFSGLP
jgi:hypothetical protein